MIFIKSLINYYYIHINDNKNVYINYLLYKENYNFETYIALIMDANTNI